MRRRRRRYGAFLNIDCAEYMTRFIRIRRSALVSVQAIQTVEPYGKGMYVLTLRDGRKLVSSRDHQAGLRRLLTSSP